MNTNREVRTMKSEPRVVLVAPNSKAHTITPPLGLGYLAACTRARGHEAAILDLARERSEKNPVFYVQYAYARIAGILRQGGDQQSTVESGEVDYSLLQEAEERVLIRRLLEFPEVVAEAGAGPGYPIHKLAFYAQEVASDFHRFYHEHRVLQVEEDLRRARLELVRASEAVLHKLLVDLIGVSAPERM